MYNTDELKKREGWLIKAFTDVAFEEVLKVKRLEIEAELKRFVDFLKVKLLPEQKIYENIESRIKSRESFQEKIYRKDYIKNWKITDNIDENKQIIATHLPDLLGFRINCFFWQDEKVIYAILKDYYQQGNFSKFELDFTENTRQENGHNIYKISGLYDNQFCFEIQIKSIMHNIWGEVEHKTIYKNRDYDTDVLQKKAITEEIFNILHASDKQLVSLFKKKNDERQLIYALFFEKTKKGISTKSATDILAKHYSGFFEVFSDAQSFKHIKQYVACSLLDLEYKKIDIEIDEIDKKTRDLKDYISSEFLEYNLKCLSYICDLIYNIQDFDHFMLFLSKYLLGNYVVETDDIDSDGDAFGDEEYETLNDYRLDISTMLENKIGGRKKNG